MAQNNQKLLRDFFSIYRDLQPERVDLTSNVVPGVAISTYLIRLCCPCIAPADLHTTRRRYSSWDGLGGQHWPGVAIDVDCLVGYSSQPWTAEDIVPYSSNCLRTF